ncbi:MAG: hypothetical protein Q8P00_05625, partial [Dehalococcoidia bacterium]|nr:hypothetical protein [Dehalococcoidia bacterium]
MKLSGMLEIVREIPAINGLQALVARQGQHRVQVLEAAKPCLIAALHESAKGPVIVLCANPEAARELHEQLVYWCPEGALLYRFPERDALPHERLAADPAVVIERMKTLSALSGWGGGMAGRAIDIMSRGPLVLTSVVTLMTRMLSPERLRALAREMKVGMVAEPDWLIAQWEAAGYDREDTVEVPGTMGRRGGIVDIFPITSSFPVRIEFVGDKVESLRLFDPANQRSLEAVQSIMVTPAAELLFPQGEGREAFDRFLKGLDLSGCDARAREEMGREIAQLVEGQRFEGADFYLAPSNDGMMLDFLPSNSLLILNE